MMTKLFLFFMCAPLILTAQPWGKDADLAHCKRTAAPVCQTPCSPSILASIGEKAIRFHQEIISPADGPRSHFYPSSSQYTLEAMKKYGFFHGYILGCDRLMRENSEEWVYRKIRTPQGTLLKWDPVP